nr:heterogeneous nuclear ribonucleoprotein R-like isoform X1 [Ipomoea batatas]
MLMMAMSRGLKDPLQCTVKAVLVNMTLYLAQNVHTLHWMMFLLNMLRQEFAVLVHVWTMTLEDEVLLSMGMPMVTGPGRPNLGYSSSRSSMASQDSHGLYSSRQGMGYDRGSYGSSDVGGVYTSGYSGDYISHGSDMGGSSYSSIYSNRDLGGGGYMRSGGSRSYY